MNVPLDYDDDAEWKVTPSVISGDIDGSAVAIGLSSSIRRRVSPVSNMKGSAARPHCRSVLRDITNQPAAKPHWRGVVGAVTRPLRARPRRALSPRPVRLRIT